MSLSLTVKVANREFIASGDADDVLRAFELFTKGPREQSKDDVVRAIALVEHAEQAVRKEMHVAAPKTPPLDRASKADRHARIRAFMLDFLKGGGSVPAALINKQLLARHPDVTKMMRLAVTRRLIAEGLVEMRERGLATTIRLKPPAINGFKSQVVLQESV